MALKILTICSFIRLTVLDNLDELKCINYNYNGASSTYQGLINAYYLQPPCVFVLKLTKL